MTVVPDHGAELTCQKLLIFKLIQGAGVEPA